jgi:hypothetical protein
MKGCAMKYVLPLVLTVYAAAAVYAGPTNEAVRVLPGGKRVVDEPPGPRNGLRPKTEPSFWRPGVYLPSYVIDTSNGLKECSWPWVDSGCRNYVPKQDRRERAWVVKYSGRWMKCPRRDDVTGCVGYYDLPNMVGQD